MIFFTFIFTFIFNVFIFEMTFALNQGVPKECRYFGEKILKNFKSRDVTFSLFSKVPVFSREPKQLTWQRWSFRPFCYD